MTEPCRRKPEPRRDHFSISGLDYNYCFVSTVEQDGEHIIHGF